MRGKSNKDLVRVFPLNCATCCLFSPMGKVFTAIYGSGGALCLRRNSENFGCGVKVRHFRAFYWKIPGNKWNFER